MKWQEALKRVRELLDVHLFDIKDQPVTVGTIAIILVLLLVTWWISRMVQIAVAKALRRASSYDEGTIEAFQRLVRYLVIVLGLSVAIHTVGINLSALFAAGAFFAVAIGFAMQNITANWVSGIILLGERTIKPGDVLEFEGQLVQVRDMHMRVTVARTLDDEDLIIPNSSLAQAAVTNFTFRDRNARVRALVGVEYSSDMRQVRRVLEEAIEDLPWRAKRKPVVLLADFGASSVDFEVSVWIDDPWKLRRAQSDLREAIWFALKDAEITIAFPQLDVHFDPEVSRGLSTAPSVPQATERRQGTTETPQSPERVQ